VVEIGQLQIYHCNRGFPVFQSFLIAHSSVEPVLVTCHCKPSSFTNVHFINRLVLTIALSTCLSHAYVRSVPQIIPLVGSPKQTVHLHTSKCFFVTTSKIGLT